MTMVIMVMAMFIMKSICRALTQWLDQVVESKSQLGHNNIQFSFHQGLYISFPWFYYC